MKKIFISTLACGMALTAISTSALAAEANYGTNGVVVFEENDEIITPVDPEIPTEPVDPINPIDPEIPVTPGTPGPLSLDYASNLNFGKQKITSVDKTYYAAVQQITDKEGNVKDRENYVQVSDTRGDALGWQLSVKQAGQFKTEDGDELKGAKILFTNAEMVSAMDSPVPSTVQTEFDLTANGTGELSNVVAAKNGEAAGTWVYRFGNEETKAKSIKLEVPGKTTKSKDKQYKTAIVWTLSDIPTAE